MKKKVLCMTRKYPPSVGGMEKFCADLYGKLGEQADIDTGVIALGKSQKHLIWFFPYCIFYLMFNARKWDVILFSDALFAGAAFVAKIFSPKTILITDIHGLDILYPNKLYQWYMKHFLDKFDVYVCNSKNTEELLNSRNIWNTIIIHRGVDVHKFDGIKRDKEAFAKKYQIDSNQKVIITVGRLVKRKGVEWFVRNVVNELEDDIVYMIAGGGEQYDAIRQAIQEKKLEHRVKLLGKISEKDLNELYVNADIFVMPNIKVEGDVEGFGIVAIEAASAGLIVVASDVDGISDAVVDKVNGYLVESENVKAFTRMINLIINGKIELSADKIREYTVSQYSMDSIALKYLEIIRR